MTMEEAINELELFKKSALVWNEMHLYEAIDMAIEALSADSVPQSEQYKRGYEDAKRALLIEYARESENMRKRIAKLEVMLNAYREISADEVEIVQCKDCRWYDNRYGDVCHNPRYGDGNANYQPPYVDEDYWCKDGYERGQG